MNINKIHYIINKIYYILYICYLTFLCGFQDSLNDVEFLTTEESRDPAVRFCAYYEFWVTLLHGIYDDPTVYFLIYLYITDQSNEISYLQ